MFIWYGIVSSFPFDTYIFILSPPGLYYNLKRHEFMKYEFRELDFVGHNVVVMAGIV